MFVRLTYLYFMQGQLDEAKKVYMAEIAPVIRRQSGNKQALLLEPAEGSDEWISYSVWESESDIRRFEESAEYPPVINRIKELVSKPPSQKYYSVHN